MRDWIHLIGVIIGLIGILLGCGESTSFNTDGRLFVVNNTIYWNNFGDSAGDYRHIGIEWEGEEILIPRNMDNEGRPTGVGAIEITPEPLPGGTKIDCTVYYRPNYDKKPFPLSALLLQSGQEAVIDGDITIEIYSVKWCTPSYCPGSPNTISYARVVKGKFDGVHPYPELTRGS